MNGWIKLHRKLLASDVFQNEKLFKIFTYCLLKATHTDHQQIVGKQKVDLKSGQFVFGRKKAALELNMKESTVRDYMNVLKNDNVITISPTNKFSVITIVNWGLYQDKEDDNRQQNDSRIPTERQQNDTNKKGKNEKNKEEEERQDPFYLFENNICMLNNINRDSLISWCNDLGDDLVIAAIKLAAKYNARSYKYFEDILREWIQQNIKTVDDARLYVKEKNKKKNNVVRFSKKKTADDIDWDNI